MCGILGLLTEANETIPVQLRDALIKIQHRGYDGAGLAVDWNNKIHLEKGCGLIKNVLTDELLQNNLPPLEELGNFGIAHTRYKTIGECSGRASQPLISKNKKLCLAHNGQIDHDHHLPDSGYFLEILERELGDLEQIEHHHIWEVVKHIFQTVQGSYSCLLMIAGFGFVAFRDPQGIRPLIYARSITDDDSEKSVNHWICSESVPFSEGDYLLRDVQPGECLIFQANGPIILSHQYDVTACSLNPCIFEYIYLAHPNSCINKISVREARLVLGELLAKQIQTKWSYLNIDVVVPVPETSVIATENLAKILGVPLRKILELNPNRKQPRSFILPTQEERIKAVQEKFLWRAKDGELTGKNVLIVDDSIVRGTTLKYILQMFREHCPDINHLWVASVAPPIRYKNIRGIDVPDHKLLIAYERNSIQIANELGADLVIYQDFDKMLYKFYTWPGIKINGYETGMFTGQHL